MAASFDLSLQITMISEINESPCITEQYENANAADSELIPIEFAECDGYYKDFNEVQYPYSTDEDFQYPSASASYSGYDAEQNFVRLLDTDFLEIYDELATGDDSYYIGPSPVAMPIIYAMPEAEIVAESSCETIQHATLIESSDPKIKQELSADDFKTVCNIYRRTQSGNRLTAIAKWRYKKSQAVCKARNKCALSARQKATACRSRTQGKFKKVKAKWITATEYFHLESKEPHWADEQSSSTTLGIPLNADIIIEATEK